MNTQKEKAKKTSLILNFVLLFLLILSTTINQIILTKTSKALGMEFITLNLFNNPKNNIKLTGNLAQDAAALVISQGVPAIYGGELVVSFDRVEQSMNIMKQFDPTYGNSRITLTGDNLKRYIDVGLRISCEFCCGAQAIIAQDGQAACGCAHSQAMRGLLAYLIQNHSSEYSNDELLRELGRWKGLYFPKQMTKKMAEQLQNGKFTSDIAALMIGLKMPKYGKADQKIPLPSEIENLPNMVGGC